MRRRRRATTRRLTCRAAALLALTGVCAAPAQAGSGPGATVARGARPVLRASNGMLRWTPVRGARTYLVRSARANHRHGRRTAKVHGTQATPRPRPGARVSYSVKALFSGARWSRPVVIAFPLHAPATQPHPVQPPQAAAATSAAGQAGPSGLAVGPQRFGVANAAGWGAAATRTAASLGISSDRIEVGPRDSQATTDQLVQNDAAAGLRPLVVVNQYAKPLSSIDPAAFSSWAAAIAARYGPGGSFWAAHPELNAALAPDYFEVENEPYLPVWDGQPDPAAYARLFIAAASAGRAASPGTHWLLASGTSYSDPSGTPRSWDRDVLAAAPGIASYADGVTAHPYGARDPSGDPASGWAQLATVRNDFPSLPVWITEVGVSSSNNPAGHDAGEQEKAVAVSWYVQQVRATPWIQALFVYGFADTGTDPANSEQNFGLLDHTLQPLPAWTAYRQALG